MSTKELILKLFTSNTEVVYEDQYAIAESIKLEFNIVRTQSAVSKALDKLSGYVINYSGKDYSVLKTDEGYKFCFKDKVLDEITFDFASKGVFENYDVFTIKNSVVGYTIKEEYHKYVKDGLLKAFDEASFFEFISRGNKLYILLKNGSKLYSDLCYLPQAVKGT